MKVLVTGAAGFIGSKIMYLLAQRGDEVVGIDNLNTYYDLRIKTARLATCGFLRAHDIDPSARAHDGDPSARANDVDPVARAHDIDPQAQVSQLFPNCRFLQMDICAKENLDRLFAQEHFEVVLHFAAQAGVRYSIDHPYDFLDSNIYGFLNILEACRHQQVGHLLYASSSSVYGLNNQSPNRETDQVDTPVSLYGATKKSAELMAHSYAKLYGLPVTGLRFFSVYGPWGRPDMSPMLFARAIEKGEPIKVFNNGDMSRDFTYIDDVAEAVLRLIPHIPDGTAAASQVPYAVYNVGCSHPVRLMDFIKEIEAALGRTAEKIYLPMQPGDVLQTYADTSRLEAEIGFKPSISLQEGIRRFIAWYRSGLNPIR